MYYMYHSIPREQVGSLAFRVISGVLYMVCLYTAVKYVPLVYISLVNTLGPLLIAVASYFILRVALSKLDTTILLVSFYGVIILITGTLSEGDFENPTT